MIKTVWITRTQPGASQSAISWQSAGCKALIAPLLKVGPPRKQPPKPPHKALLIFTSPNGVWAYDRSKDHPVITVGDKTAEVARAAGFRDVMSAKGTSDDVTVLVLKKADTSTPIVHISGQHVRGSISEDLMEAGFTAQRHIYYSSHPVIQMPAMGGADIVALYSPLAAQTLASFTPNLSGKTIISISAATDAQLGDISARRLIAAQPNEAAMIALLKPALNR